MVVSIESAPAGLTPVELYMPTTSHFNNYHEVVEHGVSWTTKTNSGKKVMLTLFEHYWLELVRDKTDAIGTFMYDFIHKTGSNAGTEWNYEITFCGLNGAWQHNITTGKWRRLDRAIMSRCRSRSRSQPRGNARLLALPAPAQEDPELEAEPPWRRKGVWASSDSDSQAVHDGSVSHPSEQGASSSSLGASSSSHNSETIVLSQGPLISQDDPEFRALWNSMIDLNKKALWDSSYGDLRTPWSTR